MSGFQEPAGGTSSPSSGTEVGSKPIRAILRMLRNIDISADATNYGNTFVPVISNPWYHKASTFKLQNPAQTFATGFESAALLADQTIKIPIITATESSVKKDELTFLKQSQVFENKTIDIILNTVKDPAANTTYYAGFDADGRVVKTLISSLPGGSPGADTITNSMIAAHTSTKITITSKGQLNSQIGYKDESNWVTDAMVAAHTSSKISITTKGQLNSAIVYTDQANAMGDFDTTFRSSRLILRDSDNSHGYIFAGANLSTNRTINYPLLTSNDTPLFADFAATVINKSMSGSSNTFTNIGDSAISSHTSTKITITTKAQLNSQIAYKDESDWLTNSHVADGTLNWAKVSKSGSIVDDLGDAVFSSVASQDIIHRNGSSQWVNKAKGSNNTFLGIDGSGNLAYAQVADAGISAHTSTKISITAKGQLNSAILYNDVDNNLGSHYVLFTEIAQPSNPSAGTQKIWVDSTTHELSQIDSTGAVKKFSDGSGGGGGAPTTSTYLTLSNDGTLSAERVLTASTRVTITDAGANSTATLDVGSGSIVDAYIGSHTSTKISITAKGQLNSSIMYEDEDNNLGAHYLDISEIATPGSPAANHLRLYMHSTDEHLKVKNSAGAITDLYDIVHGHGFTDLTGSIDPGQIDPNTITDSMIAAHTSTKITITTKAQLNSSILYSDVDNVLGDHYMDFGDIAVPSNPASGIIRLFNNTATGELSVRKSGGTTVSLEAGGGGSFTGQLAYSYIIYKDGSTYKAFNTSTLVVDHSGSEPGAVFNSTINSMNAAGGGTALVKAAVYPCTTTITLKDNTGLIGDSKYKTILRNNQTTSQLLKYTQGAGAFLTNFTLANLTMEAGNTAGNGSGASDTHWYSSGATNVTLLDVVFKTYTAPTGPAIQVFFDTFSNVNDNTNIQVHFCEFTGPAGGEDYFGCGRMVNCDWSHNYVHDTTSQGIGVGGSRRSKYNDNTLVNIATNAIGMENDCQDNQYCNNTLWNTGGLKMSQEGATATHISRNNICKNNHISYGMGGIEAGISIGDDISDNTFYRCERNGIHGSFAYANLNRNTFEDTNWGFNTQNNNNNTTSTKVGGIFCLNNTTPLPTNSYNTISGNTFKNTNVTFTDPVSSSTGEEGDLCGIVLDTNYINTTLNGNVGENLDVELVINYASTTANKLTSGGWYANAEDRTFVLDEQILRLKGSDNNPVTWLDSTGQTAPNQAFDLFAQYTKQGSATNVPFTFGYNSDITTMEWWSKWSGSNKNYFSINAANNSVNFNAEIKTGPNLLEFDDMTAPGNAPSGQWRMYEDAADIRMKLKDSAGFVSDMITPHNPLIKRWGCMQPGNSTAVANTQELTGMLADWTVTGGGTNSVSFDGTEGALVNLQSANSSGVNAGYTTGANMAPVRRAFKTRYMSRKKVDSTTSAREYFGFTSNTTTPVSDTIIANSDSGIVVGFRSSDTNFQIIHNDGSGAASVTQVTGPVAKDANFHTVIIEWTAGGNIDVTFDGTKQTISTDLPGTTTNLYPFAVAQTSAAVQRTYSSRGAWIESDK